MSYTSSGREVSRVPGGFRCSVRDLSSKTVLQVEGRLSGQWVSEVRRVWSDLKTHFPDAQFALELADVHYVDEQGMLFLQFLFVSGVEITGKGPYIQGVIEEIREACKERRGNMR